MSKFSIIIGWGATFGQGRLSMMSKLKMVTTSYTTNQHMRARVHLWCLKTSLTGAKRSTPYELLELRLDTKTHKQSNGQMDKDTGRKIDTP